MKVLLIKTSSMGDVFHTFPALSDAQSHIPNLKLDWVVEKGFADIPSWHPLVNKVYPVEIRRWRKSLLKKQTRHEINAFFAELKTQEYDLILDAQGLLKSAWIARKLSAPIAGYDWHSAREPLASLFYKFKYPVAKNQHAILRLRQLVGQSLGYSIASETPIIYGLDTQSWQKPAPLFEQFAEQTYWVFLHGTTWDTKLWPEKQWHQLLLAAEQQNIHVMLPWGNDEEKQRALRMQALAEKETGKAFVWVPEKRLSLNDMAKALKHAQAVVSVDTGLSHVSAALEVPMVVLYRVTDPKLVGADGVQVTRLASPCAPKYLKKFDSKEQEAESLQGIGADDVLLALNKQIQNKQTQSTPLQVEG